MAENKQTTQPAAPQDPAKGGKKPKGPVRPLADRLTESYADLARLANAWVSQAMKEGNIPRGKCLAVLTAINNVAEPLGDAMDAMDAKEG